MAREPGRKQTEVLAAYTTYRPQWIPAKAPRAYGGRTGLNGYQQRHQELMEPQSSASFYLITFLPPNFIGYYTLCGLPGTGTRPGRQGSRSWPKQRSHRWWCHRYIRFDGPPGESAVLHLISYKKSPCPRLPSSCHPLPLTVPHLSNSALQRHCAGKGNGSVTWWPAHAACGRCASSKSMR